jgi:hypothetical protein
MGIKLIDLVSHKKITELTGALLAWTSNASKAQILLCKQKYHKKHMDPIH